MSITNAVYKKKFTVSFFEKNSSLLQLINAHNKFMDLYASGIKTEDGIKIAISQENTSNSFYQDLDIEKVIEHCAQLQKNLDDLAQELKKAQQLGQLKDSYWKNMQTATNAILAALGGGGIMGGLMVGGIFIGCGIAGSALIAMPIVYLGIGIILLATSLIIAGVTQYQAKEEYNKQYPQFSSAKDNPDSFFVGKKQELEKEIMDIVVPSSFEPFR